MQTIINALETRDYITNVSPIRKDGAEIGYTISFAYGDTITIYHGENGKSCAKVAQIPIQREIRQHTCAHAYPASDGKLTDILFGEIADVVIVIHVRSLLSFDCHKYTRFRGVCQ